jgi:signal transduction histidine kinase
MVDPMGVGYVPKLPRRWRTAAVVTALAIAAPLLATEPGVLPPVAGRVVAGVLIVAQAVVLWWFDQRPQFALAVVLGASAGLQVLFPFFGPGLAFVALCTYAWLLPAVDALWGLGAAVVAACGPAAVRGRWELVALWFAASMVAWSLGSVGRAREARRQAERRQAVLEERARIARELHDVLSHTVSVMVVQAAAADDVFEVDPQRARQALRRTEQAGRQALAELRWFLRTVRADADADAHTDAGSDAGSSDGEPTPQPTLADVERLADTMGEAGLPVMVTREGRRADADVPLGLQLGAYRIVQEALTNTLRHARASRAEVLLRVSDGEVYVRVRDDGRGGALKDSANGSVKGHGILGMRERAGLVGGVLEAGPRAGGGFEVGARLPLGDPS